MLRIVLLFLLFIVVWTITDGNILLFPQNTVFQFTIGISVPVAMDKKGGIAFTSGFQFNYVLPWNLSQLDPPVIPAREIGTFDLRDVYIALEDLLYKHGWQGTGQCLLRTICEFAETPLNQRESTKGHKQNILEEITYLLLTWGGNGRNCMMRTICEAAETPLKDEGLVGQLLHVMLTPDFGKGSGFNTSDDDYYHQAAEAGRSGNDCALTYPSCFEGRGLLDMVTKLDYI